MSLSFLAEIPYHNIDPVAFTIGVPVRWYGIGYLIAFLIAYVVMTRAAKRNQLRLVPDDVTSFLMYAMVGVFLGGRVGDLILYNDYFTSGRFFSAPLELFGVTPEGFEGIRGLSFHGGLAGVMIAGFLFCFTRARREWRGLDEAARVADGRAGFWARLRGLMANVFDVSALAVPAGIFVVRMANFINGELYGRLIVGADGKPVFDAASAPGWAMRFPTSPEGMRALEHHYYLALQEKFAETSVAERSGMSLDQFVAPQVDALARKLPVDPDVWAKVSPHVALRHPSQVYQALLEGLLVLGLVWLVRKRMPKRGMIAGVFLIGYALTRIPMELFREPDSVFDKDGRLGWWGSVLDSVSMTQGQFLSLLMALGGVSMLVLCGRSKNPHMESTFRPVKV
jgi:phosphatidylglycerol:prolipoprotein diacylglycerol transferase